MDMIEENVKLYDCMKRSEKQFIVEVSAILTWDMATSIDWHLQVKELACDTFKHRFKVKGLPREKAVVQQFLMVRKTNRSQQQALHVYSHIGTFFHFTLSRFFFLLFLSPLSHPSLFPLPSSYSLFPPLSLLLFSLSLSPRMVLN